jgi:hypothetical protein
MQWASTKNARFRLFAKCPCCRHIARQGHNTIGIMPMAVLCRDDDAKFPPPPPPLPETAFFTDKLTHIMRQIWMINFIQLRRLKIWSTQPISYM